MMMRVNEVSDSTSADANDSAVTSRKIFTADEPPPDSAISAPVRAAWVKASAAPAAVRRCAQRTLPGRPSASLRRSSWSSKLSSRMSSKRGSSASLAGLRRLKSRASNPS